MNKKGVLAGAIVALLVLSVLTLAFGILPGRSSPVTITVPDDFLTIQVAVNAANSGDTVYVRAGTYVENVVVNKALALVGENPQNTTVDGGDAGTVVSISADDVNVTGFTIRNSGEGYAGIRLEGASRCNIFGNNMTANDGGIEILSSSNNRVSGNNITANLGGITVEWSADNNSVVGNNIATNNVGVFLAYACNNSIVSNNITNNWYVSVDLGSYSYYNSVSGNNITNSGDGLDLGSYADNNSVVGNNVVNNGLGVRIWADTPNNMFYHNSFIDNAQQISSWGSTNVWDNGSNGNYWSDYTARYPNASETNGSGVWDTAYAIDANNVDRYPLVNQVTPLIPLYTVTIVAGSGGPVVYSYHGGSGSVPSGQTISLNVTLGTQISLTAYPSLSFVFQGWNTNGRVSTSNASSLSTTATANGDGGVTASFASGYTISFVESGLPEGNSWSITLGDVTQSSTTNTIIFSELNGKYNYTVGYIFSHTNSPPQGSIVVNGADVIQFITFTRISTYTHPLNSFLVEPSETDLNTNNAGVGTEFNVTVCACMNNGTFAWQVEMTFNPAEVQAVAAGYTGMTGSQFFAGHPTYSVSPQVDNVRGSVTLGESILGEDSGGGNDASLMWVEFQVVSVPNATHPSLDGTFGINNTYTYFVDRNGSEIPTIRYDGAYSFSARVHDVAVTSVTADRAWVYQGYSANVSVTVLNKGDFDENVTVTLYYNITANEAVGIQNVTLAPGQNQTIAFVWNTTGVPYCLNYTMTAVASIPADNNPADNTLACGPINVRIVGDINGDGVVDIRAIHIVATANGSRPSNPRWNPDADITGSVYLVPDGIVDLRDIALIAKNFGKHYP